MTRLVFARNHPFPLLLHLEWLLLVILCITLLGEFVPNPIFPPPRQPFLTVLSLLTFGGMGLWLPRGRLLHKILYTVLEFGLVLFAATVGGWGIRVFPALYVIVVIRSCLIFEPPGRLIVATVAFASFPLMLLLRILNPEAHFLPELPKPLAKLPVSPDSLQSVPFDVKFVVWHLILSVALSLGLALLFVLLLVNALLAERRSREKLAIANDQLRQYALRIEDQATLQERNRIARDIHDSLGHALTALNLQLEGAIKLWQNDPSKSQSFLLEAKRLGSTALNEVRHSVSTLRFNPVQAQSLEAAIAALVQEFYQISGVLPAFQFKLPTSRVAPTEINTAIYRVVQEALTNVCKHAAATEVTICLEATAATITLSIQDNGRGFDPQKNTTGFGIQGMQERLTAIGGQFDIHSKPGKGCRIVAMFPLPLVSA